MRIVNQIKEIFTVTALLAVMFSAAQASAGVEKNIKSLLSEIAKSVTGASADSKEKQAPRATPVTLAACTSVAPTSAWSMALQFENSTACNAFANNPGAYAAPDNGGLPVNGYAACSPQQTYCYDGPNDGNWQINYSDAFLVGILWNFVNATDRAPYFTFQIDSFNYIPIVTDCSGCPGVGVGICYGTCSSIATGDQQRPFQLLAVQYQNGVEEAH